MRGSGIVLGMPSGGEPRSRDRLERRGVWPRSFESLAKLQLHTEDAVLVAHAQQ